MSSLVVTINYSSSANSLQAGLRRIYKTLHFSSYIASPNPLLIVPI